jgi:endonuclease III
LDDDHRTWKKIGVDLILSQEKRGDNIIIDGNIDEHDLYRLLGLWYEADDYIAMQPKVIRLLYKEIPVRQSWVQTADLEILFAAAILSPQVAWEVNLTWVSILREHFGIHILSKIANLEPNQLEEVIQSRANVRKLGYHARILVRAFQNIRDKLCGVESIARMQSSEARKALLQIYGIGPKISTFIVQASHGDLDSPCVDRHVIKNAIALDVVAHDSQAYFPNACIKYIDDCSKCPYVKRCAAGQLMKSKGSSLASSILYFIDT